MSKMPREVVVGYQRIKIKKEESQLGDDYGRYRMHAALITVNAKQPELEIPNTLIHEILHAIWFTYGLREKDGDEERIVNTVANGLTQVFRDNPTLIKWLQKAIAQKSKANIGEDE